MHYNQKQSIAQIEQHKQSLLNEETNISLTAILQSEECNSIISECREFRDRIYSPQKTLLIFIKQVLDPDKSCKNAVAGVLVEFPPISINFEDRKRPVYPRVLEELLAIGGSESRRRCQ